MLAVVACDNRTLGGKVREILMQAGHDCPSGQVVPLNQAIALISQVRPELVVVSLSPEPEEVIGIIRELRPSVRGHLLVIGPAFDSRLILRAQRDGADQYLDEAEVEVELVAALGRLHTIGDEATEPGQIISILSPSGGSGASTLAVNLAAALAQKAKTAVLFDLKLETGDLAPLLNLKPTHTIADLCKNAARMDRSMFERSLAQHPCGVAVLAPPRMFEDVVHVTPQGVSQALVMARTLFPYVVADLDHTYREEQTLVLRQSDMILLVFRLDFTSLRHTRRTLDHLDRLGVSRERIRLVVSRYGQPKEVPAHKAEEVLEMKITYYIPEEPKTINRANNNGVPAILESPRATVCKSMVKLAQSVNGLVK